MSPEFPLGPLAEPLAPDACAPVRTALRGLLAWHSELSRWPALSDLPAATPIVSLYLDGGLVGCSGSGEGDPSTRLARAFVQTLGDPRFGGVLPEARARLVAQVSYPYAPRRVKPAAAAAEIEVGTHGLFLVAPNARASLLPDVAREHALDAEALLDALADKSGLARAEWPEDGLFTFETSRVVARLAETQPLPGALQPVEAAARWLAARVRDDGIEFGIDPASGAIGEKPPLLHGRVALLVRALFAQSAGRGAAVRAKRWLEGELSRGLAGDRRVALPDSLPLLARTLALASLAGVDCDDQLAELARAPELRSAPWYAAEVVAALGRRAPAELFDACVAHLEHEPFAPFTLVAARARGDEAVIRRAAAGLARCVRSRSPHRGGVGPGVPEIARTAASLEALAPVAASAEERAAVRNARAFLETQQLAGDNYAKTPEPALVSGAFPISPIAHFLQIDVTAHALLALTVRADV
jgi:hypothetical protein